MDLHLAAFEHAPDAGVIVDDDGCILAENRAARAFVDAAGTALSDMLDSSSLVRAIRERGTAEREVEVPTLQRTMLLHGVEIDELRYLVVLRDVTEQRIAERSLDRAMRIESIGFLAATAVHDLNNLLTPIACYASMLEIALPSDAREQAMVQEISVATARASAVVRDVLAYVRAPRPARGRVSLNQIVSELRGLIERILGPDIVLEIALADGLPITGIDRLDLERALLNVVANARDAMPNGGTLRIETSSESRADGMHVVLRVSDTGTGMPNTVRERVLVRASTSKPSGSGLGLLSVRRLMAAVGGELGLASEEGQGTTVTLSLPIRAPGSPTSSLRPRTVTGNETILVVEPDDAVRKATRAVLEPLGYRVFDVRSSAAALALGSAYDGTIDLLVADVMMPEMRGTELAERFRSMRPDIRVLLMTGHSRARLAEAGIGSGAPVLFKTFSGEELGFEVRRALDGVSDGH